MKFGKRYQETLSAPGIPAEWRQTAIEYRKLKKVINRVASELEELGLTSDVLKDLLKGQAEVVPTTAASGTIVELSDAEGTNAHAGPSGSHGVPAEDEKAREVRTHVVHVPETASRGREGPRLRWESSSDEEDESGDAISEKARGKRKRASRRATASYELAGTSAHPEPRIRLIFESASSHSESSDGLTSDFLVRQSSDTDPSSPNPESRFAEVDSSGDDTGSKSKEDDDSSEVASAAEPGVDDFEGANPKENTLLKRMYGMSVHSDDEEDWASKEVEVDPKARRGSLETVRAEAEAQEEQNPVPVTESLPAVDTAPDDADDEDADSQPAPRRRRHHHRRPRKEVFIPLNSDTEFLTLLAKALAALAALQAAQKKQFAAQVQLLAREVSQVSSPSRPKSDLYVWREIFALWVESQIFESEREKDRGERSVEDAETKLDWFVEQVAKRKLAKRMKHKESREALEKFIKLNVELLDLKRFQLANEEAARKILKKHDKRTALTASHGFPEFIAAASSLSTVSGTDSSRPILVLPGFPSLPHVLLSTLTSTLLPIIPQMDDYECVICGEIAFKPIKLDCGHRFCVRCLVKMQKRGQDSCPHCRQPVVLRANASNLDNAMQQYLVEWFPKEVKAKAKQNEKEAAKEELQAMGLESDRCVVV